MIKLNCAGRAFEFLKHVVKPDLKAPDQTNAQFVEEDNTFVIKAAPEIVDAIQL